MIEKFCNSFMNDVQMAKFATDVKATFTDIRREDRGSIIRPEREQLEAEYRRFLDRANALSFCFTNSTIELSSTTFLFLSCRAF